MDHVDIFHMSAVTGNDERTEMQHRTESSNNPSVLVTSHNLGGTSLNPTATYHAVITPMSWLLNQKWQPFARVAWLAQNRVTHTWLSHTGPGGYDNSTRDVYQLSGVPKMTVLHGLMS